MATVMTAGDQIVLQKAMVAPTWGPNGIVDTTVGLGAATGWFFGGADLGPGRGITPLPKQWLFHHAAQPHVSVVGGIGSGKTTIAAMSAVVHCLTTPFFKFTNTAPTAAQASLLFDWIVEQYQAFPALQRHIKHITKRPYPMIEFWNGSMIECRTAGIEGANLRGIERDWINYDECVLDSRLERTHIALRGRMRGNRPGGVPRMGRLSYTTSPMNNLWLREMWDRGWERGYSLFNPIEFLSIRVSIFENIYLKAEHIQSIVSGIAPEQIAIELKGEFPDGMGNDFTADQVSDVFDSNLNLYAEGVHIIPGIYEDDPVEEEHRPPPADYTYKTNGHEGLVRYIKPRIPGHAYVLSGDPGQGRPPHRNAPCVMVWDVSKRPFELVYFDWVYAGGSYKPFLSSYRFAMDYYQPLYQGIDSTGPQAGLHELAFEEFGHRVSKINFNGNKLDMLTALKVLIQERGLVSPLIEGFKKQLGNYSLADDKPGSKIPQDIVCCAMMAAWLARSVTTAHTPPPLITSAARATRGSRAGGSRGHRPEPRAQVGDFDAFSDEPATPTRRRGRGRRR